MAKKVEEQKVSKISIGYNEMGSKQMPASERAREDYKHREMKRSYQYPDTFVRPKQ